MPPSAGVYRAMDQEDLSSIHRELDQLKKTLVTVESRLAALEIGAADKKSALAAAEVTTHPIVEQKKREQIEAEDAKKATTPMAVSALERFARLPGDTKLREPKAPHQEPFEKTIEEKAVVGESPETIVSETPSRNLEITIGSYWLNRLGVVTIVLAAVFLIIYSFNYFGPALKLLTGFVISAGLIWFGHKTSTSKERGWYGQGLMGGGWGLAYFCTYAAHFIPSLQLIDSLPLELVLLGGVAAGAMVHAIYARAEIVALFSVLLGELSVGSAPPSLTACGASFIVAIAVAYVSRQQNWFRLLLWGSLIVYMGWFYDCQLLLDAAYDVEKLYAPSMHSLISLGYLLALWAIFQGTVFFNQSEDAEKSKALKYATFFSAIILYAGLATVFARTYPDSLYMAAFIPGAIYLGGGFTLRRLARSQSANLYYLLGLSLLTCAGLLKFTGNQKLFFTPVEIVFLVGTGLRYDLKAFRSFAIFLSVIYVPLWLFTSTNGGYTVEGISSPERFFAALIALAVFGFCHYIHQTARFENVLTETEKRISPHFYLAFANLAAFAAPCAVVSLPLRAALWVATSASNTAVALQLKRIGYSIYGTAFLFFSGIALLVSVDEWQWGSIGFILLALYSFSFYCRSFPKAESASIRAMYSIAANVLLTIFLLVKLHGSQLSCAFGAEGIALLAVGFYLRDKIYRVSGLIALALLACKLLFVDLAQADTLQRIVSFLVAGIVFLAASYAYTWYTKRVEETESES
jgi:Predicted membrane protein (DUF2339)